MFSNLLFLSHGIQIALFLLLVGLILVFMKMTAFEKRLKNMEDNMLHYVTTEEYMETFNAMWEEKQRGGYVGAYQDYDHEEHDQGDQQRAGLSSIQE